MSGCRVWRDFLSAKLDGMLSAEELEAVTTHMRECQNCRLHSAGLEATRKAVGRLDGRLAPSTPLVARVEVEATRYGPNSRRRWRAGGLAAAAAIAAAALVTVVLPAGKQGIGTGGESRHLPDLCTILVEDHLRYLASDDAAEVRSSEPPAVERWFATRLDFSVRVPVLAGADLEGGRLCFIDGRRVALLFYRRDDKRISVFALADARLGGMRPGPGGTWRGGMHGYNVSAIRAHDVTYAAVADLPPAEMVAMWKVPEAAQP